MGKSKGKRAALVGKTSASPAAVIKSPSPASESTHIETDPSLSGLGNAGDEGLLTLQKPGDPDMTTSCSIESSDSLNRNPGLSPQAFDVIWDCKYDLVFENAVFHFHPDLVGSRSTSSATRKSIKSLPISASSPAMSQNPTSSPSSPATYAISTSFQSSTTSVSPITAPQASSSPESSCVSPGPTRVKETMAETCSGSGIPIKQTLESQPDVKQHRVSILVMRNNEMSNPLEEQMNELGSGQRDWATQCRLVELRCTRAPERIITLMYRLEDKIVPQPFTFFWAIFDFYYLKFPRHMTTDLHLRDWEIEEYVRSREGKMMNETTAEEWEVFLTTHYADEINRHGIRHLCETYLWKLAHENLEGYPPAYFYEKKLTPKMVEEAVEALCEPLMDIYPGDEARKARLLRAMADAERFGIYDQSPTVSQTSTTVQSKSAPSLSSTPAPLTRSPTKAPLLPAISEPTRVRETMAETCSGSGIPIKQTLESQPDVKQHFMSNPLNPAMRNNEMSNPLEEQMSELGSGQRDWATQCRLVELRCTRAPERLITLMYRLEDKIVPQPFTFFWAIFDFYYLKFPRHMTTDLHLRDWEIEEYVRSREGKMMNETTAEEWEVFLTTHYADEINRHGIRHLCETYLWKLAHENLEGYPPAYFYEKKLTPKMVEEAVEALCEPLMDIYPGDEARKARLLRAMADAERFGIYDQ